MLALSACHCTCKQRCTLLQEERLPKQHELLRQGHAITHVFLLLEGSVEVTAATAAADAALLHPDTLADTSGHAPPRVPSLVTYPSTFELPTAASLSSERSLEPVPSLAPAESLPSAASLGDRKVRSLPVPIAPDLVQLWVGLAGRALACSSLERARGDRELKTCAAARMSATVTAVAAAQVKVRLGVQSAPCVLGDDPLRGPSGSFVSVITATPCRVAVIALNRFKSSVEVWRELRLTHLLCMRACLLAPTRWSGRAPRKTGAPSSHAVRCRA